MVRKLDYNKFVHKPKVTFKNCVKILVLEFICMVQNNKFESNLVNYLNLIVLLFLNTYYLQFANIFDKT